MKSLTRAYSCLFRGIAKGELLDPRWALFSANSFIAAMLAIYIAFRFGLPRPYWAMLTVYLIAQPLAGAVRSKALFRLVGTVLGASAAVALVPALVDEPMLLSIAITAWAGFCLYISLHDRTPRSYAFMLATRPQRSRFRASRPRTWCSRQLWLASRRSRLELAARP